jgi:threonine/homoserine/homoserine lactone efflux protein
MPTLETLLIFTAAAFAMNALPGPSNLYVLSRSIAQGPRAGLVAAAGLASGSLLHAALTAAGLAAIFAYSPTAYGIFKLVGGGYLIWLGIQHLHAKNSGGLPGAALPQKSMRRVYGESIAVELLNPKTALFFLAFLPQFADAAAGPMAPQLLLLGAITVATAIPCDALVALGAGGVARAIRRSPAILTWQNRISGAILIGLGAWVALARRSG